jgi:hypothetical protein
MSPEAWMPVSRGGALDLGGNREATFLPSPFLAGFGRVPACQEHRKTEKGHTKGDPDLFPVLLTSLVLIAAPIPGGRRAGHRSARCV